MIPKSLLLPLELHKHSYFFLFFILSLIFRRIYTFFPFVILFFIYPKHRRNIICSLEITCNTCVYVRAFAWACGRVGVWVCGCVGAWVRMRERLYVCISFSLFYLFIFFFFSEPKHENPLFC
jgi:hypothetical protein